MKLQAAIKTEIPAFIFFQGLDQKQTTQGTGGRKLTRALQISRLVLTWLFSHEGPLRNAYFWSWRSSQSSQTPKQEEEQRLHICRLSPNLGPPC